MPSLTLYHGSYSEIASFLPREVRSIDSIGTWFTTSKLYALNYGPVVMAIEYVVGDSLFEVGAGEEGSNDFLRMWGVNADIARKAGFTAEAKILETTLPDDGILGRYNALLESNHYDLRQEAYAMAKKMKRVRAANVAARTMLNSAGYMEQMRAMLESRGFTGIHFRNSRIDLCAEDLRVHGTHDVYVLFHTDPISARILTAEPACATVLSAI